MGIKLLSGRDLDDQDTATRVKVVVASETAARRIFGTPDAVGRSLITIAEPGYPQRCLVLKRRTPPTQIGIL
jgi:hypothetical protein